MNITKGLVIDDPWIGYLLDGTKTWEMRSSPVSFRGWFGLIRKGTGAIYGVARLVDVRPALSIEEMIAAHDKHRIPESMIRTGAVAKWTTPWVLADIKELLRPVVYRHPSGAVIWVELEPVVTAAIAAQFDEGTVAASVRPALGAESINTAPMVTLAPTKSSVAVPVVPRKQKEASTAAKSPIGIGKLICEVEINQANLDNNHFYLRSHLHLFPDDIIGGSNRSKPARKEARIDWGGPEATFTDIDGERHKFFRKRAWIGQFFLLNHAKPGDIVSIEQTDALSYNIRLRPRG